jgi:hypothetical protein
MEDREGRGRFGRWLDPAPVAVAGRAGEGLFDNAGDADAAAGKALELVGEGGSEGRGYGLAGVAVDARGEVAGLLALASRSFLSCSLLACSLSRSRNRCLSRSLISCSEIIDDGNTDR